MTFLSLKQVCAHLPLFYTKKTGHDIERLLKKEFPFLNFLMIATQSRHIVFFTTSSLEAQELLWYRQEIIAFLAGHGIKKQIKIIQ